MDVVNSNFLSFEKEVDELLKFLSSHCRKI